MAILKIAQIIFSKKPRAFPAILTKVESIFRLVIIIICAFGVVSIIAVINLDGYFD